MITISAFTAGGISSIQREIDAGRYEAIGDWKYKLGCIKPPLSESGNVMLGTMQGKVFNRMKNQIVLFPVLPSNDTIGLLLPCRYQCRLLYSIDRMGLIPARTVK
jgi:hypothetical protein